MFFNSLEFIIFALVFFAFWPFVLKLKNIKFLYIIIFSCIFYGWWDWRFLFLILFTGTVDYFAALAIERWNKHKTKFLLLSLIADLGTLSIFKYTSFFIETVNDVIRLCGSTFVWAPEIPEFVLILPVGISFYTFQSMSYTIDVYKGELKPTKNFLHFFTYLSMFPQLVAGPIVRAKDILLQLKSFVILRHSDYLEAFRFIAVGFFKKCFIADNLAPFVNEAFNSAILPSSTIYWWIVMISFALQIYCDFSGYSDIAIGLGRLIGLRFKRNFNHPYLATSLSDFWDRWHISLSTWFRDYVYIPLGGNRCSKMRCYFNLVITMLLSGLWHGASLHFIIWGAFHSVGLIAEKEFSRRFNVVLPRFIKVLFTFIFVIVAWTFFRATNTNQAFSILNYMFDFNFDLIYISKTALVLIALFMICNVIRCRLAKCDLFNKQSVLFESLFIGSLLWIATFCRGIGEQFIYFQF